MCYIDLKYENKRNINIFNYIKLRTLIFFYTNIFCFIESGLPGSSRMINIVRSRGD